MRNLRTTFVCFVGSTLFLTSAGWADTPKLSEEQARTEYVRKGLKGEPSPVPGRQMIGAGTGFFVSPQRVLTAHHVIDRCAVLTVWRDDGTVATAVRVADAKKDDLALISLEEPAQLIATFGQTESTRVGEAVATVGYPSRGLPRIEPLLTVGTIAAADSIQEPSRLLIRADIRPGNSGGPVLDEHAQVVGVVTAKVDTVQLYQRTGHDIQNVGFAIATGPVLRFLEQSGIEPTPPETSLTLGIGEKLLASVKKFTVRVGCWQ